MIPFPGTIDEQHRPRPNNSDLFRRVCEGFRPGTDIDIMIRRRSKSKSRRVENYFFGVLIPLRCECSENDRLTPDEAKRDFYSHCSPIDERGNIITMSDGDFTLALQMQFLERCRDYLAREHYTESPDPDISWRDKE